MPKVTKDYANARKQSILQAAALCFSRKGFRLTNMADIAREADLSVGALYRYFSSKETMFRSLFVNAEQEYDAVWKRAKAHEKPIERIQFIIDLHFDALLDKNCLWALALDVRLRAEALDDETLAEHVRLSYDVQIEELSNLLLPTVAARRKPSPANKKKVRAAAMAIVALINEARYQALVGKSVDMREYRMHVLNIARVLAAAF